MDEDEEGDWEVETAGLKFERVWGDATMGLRWLCMPSDVLSAGVLGR